MHGKSFHTQSTALETISQLLEKQGWLVTSAIVASTVLILKTMGRILYCACGYVKFWQGDNWSSENSQHISDWYTFSHLIHGFIFYWLLQKFLPEWSVASRLVLAVIIEAAWEILENSPIIINRYRTTTVSLDYFGDSVLNSFFDILACIIGFMLARKLPIWLSIVLIIAMELGVGWMIKDNLFLNVIMLIYPVQAIKEWQMP